MKHWTIVTVVNTTACSEKKTSFGSTGITDPPYFAKYSS